MVDALVARLDGKALKTSSLLSTRSFGPAKARVAMEKLGQESQALGQAIYEATQADQAAGGDAGGGSSADDVVDAEVVEDDQENK